VGILERIEAARDTVQQRRFTQIQQRRFTQIQQLVSWREQKLGGVDRKQALSIPAVFKGHRLICSIATLPLVAKDLDNREVPIPLLTQFNPNVPNVVVKSQVLEDLLFDAVSWWRITGFDEYGRPSQVARYAPGDVSLDPPADYRKGYLPSDLPTEGVVWMEGHPVQHDQVIKFDSPNPGLLDVGCRVIARSIALDDVADLLATNPKMRGYFSPSEGADPATDEEIEDALTTWQESRSKRLDGYVPAALSYNPIQDPTPSELQLIEMQRRNDLNLANMIGVDPEDLGISTTSRTYQNDTSRQQERINTVFAPYMDAITDRLNMPDVTRPGLTVSFKLDEYLRADPKTRVEVAQIQMDMGALTVDEYRRNEGMPPLPPGAAPLQPRRVESTLGEPAGQLEAA
jgi:hypothetical protein